MGLTLGQLLRDLAAAFPQRDVKPDTLVVYKRHLEDVPLPLLADAIGDLIETAEFFPTVRAIRERAVERHLQLPTENDALTQIEARMAWARTSVGDPPTVHPIVRETLDLVGGWHSFRAADKATIVRGQFLNLYRARRAAEILAMQVQPERQLTTTSSRPRELSQQKETKSDDDT